MDVKGVQGGENTPPRRVKGREGLMDGERGEGMSMDGQGSVRRVGWPARVMRELYRREQLPAHLRWILVASAMRDWCRLVASGLRPELGDASRQVIAELVAEMFRRRYIVLGQTYPTLPDIEEDPRALPLFFWGLYLLPFTPRMKWLFQVLGAPQGLQEQLRAQHLVLQLRPLQRWEELTVHLGELLIVLTEELPARLPRARQLLAKICFQMGVEYAQRLSRLFQMPHEPQGVAHALELLRMGEYLFRVNPEHRVEADSKRQFGMIEGNACPWYSRPGWGGLHCGIFGQFQAGICSVFSLKYQLVRTIPRHGGHICRVELKPIRKRTQGKTKEHVSSPGPPHQDP